MHSPACAASALVVGVDAEWNDDDDGVGYDDPVSRKKAKMNPNASVLQCLVSFFGFLVFK
jgi:hypothetical protein